MRVTWSILGTLLLAADTLADSSWPVQKYKSESFTAPKFDITRSGQQTQPGSLFIGYTKTSTDLEAPMIFSDDGDLIWHGPTGGPVYNFRRQSLNNKIVLTYWTGYLDYTGHGFGSVQILDRDYNKIYDLCLPDAINNDIVSPRPNPNSCFVDKHESLITDQGTILLTVYNATQTDLTDLGGDSDGWVFDCLIFEMDVETQDILFRWSALDHVPVSKSNFVNMTGPDPLDLNGRKVGTKNQPWDYFHINSVQKVDQGYLANSRMTWSFYLIDPDTGNLTWTLEGSKGGDFVFDDPIFFSWQHMPRVNPASTEPNTLEIQLFNNDNIPHIVPTVNTSSGYLLSVNTNTMHVSALRDLKPADSLLAIAEGSYQDLGNDHALIGYGSVPIVQEFDGNDNLIYTGQFAANDGNAHSYRIYRFPWKATPNTLPSAAASTKRKGKTVVVYMSWNGATEYDSWTVLAGSDGSELTPVLTGVSRTGFETRATFKNPKGAYDTIAVQALKGNKVLATSDNVQIK